MTPEVSWRTVAEAAGRWLLRRLPAFIFRRYYSAEELEDHIKIRLQYARLVTATLLKGLRAPSLEVELEVFNMSPYLDIRVAGVRSSLSACDEAGCLQQFAHLDDWGGFELPHGRCRLVHLWYWLNEYQSDIVSTYLR